MMIAGRIEYDLQNSIDGGSGSGALLIALLCYAILGSLIVSLIDDLKRKRKDRKK